MCYSCYEEHGSPTEVTSETVAASQLIGRVYEFSETGGHLHIIVDDWNLEDSHIAFCEKHLSGNFHEHTEAQLQVELECLAALKRLTVSGRAVALALHDKYLKVPAGSC